MANLLLRPPADSELPWLVEMMVDFNRFEEIPWDPQSGTAVLQRLLDDASLGQVHVVIQDGAVVGSAILTYGYDLEFGGRDAFLTEIYLVPEARGRGLGEEVLSALELRAQKAGVHAIHLGVRPENGPALSLYRKVGFVPIPRLILTKKVSTVR
jgi:ribosomal protein S18 acetylase RimI-like enzyme